MSESDKKKILMFASCGSCFGRAWWVVLMY